MGHAPARIQDFVRAASANPDLAAKVAAAIDAGDNRAVLKLMAEQQWTKAPARAAPEAAADAAGPASRSPMSFEDRIANDPNIRRGIEASGVDVVSGDIEGMLDAYRRGVAPRRPTRPAPGVVDAPSAPPPTALSTSVNLPRLTSSPIGPGVPVGPPRSSLEFLDPQLSSVDSAANSVDEVVDLGPNPGDNVNQFGFEEGSFFDYPEPDARVADDVAPEGPRVIDEEVRPSGEESFNPEDFRFTDPPPRNKADSLIERLNPVRRPAGAAAAGAAAGIGAAMLMRDADAPGPTAAPAAPAAPTPPRARPTVPNVIRQPKPLSTADLAAATRPPPSVMTKEEPPLVVDYAQMARDKIRQANEIQLRERRITPESAALTREADALYQRAADARRTGNHPPIMPVEQQNDQTSAIRAQARRELAENTGSDPRSEARRIMSQLNAGQIPPGQQAAAKAEMSRLFAMADQQDNSHRTMR